MLQGIDIIAQMCYTCINKGRGKPKKNPQPKGRKDNIMKNGRYIETECKNLRELNAQLKREGETFHYIFCGFMQSANGYQQRAYLAEDENGTTYGDYINIYFGC